MHSGGVVGVVVAIGWLESVEVGVVNAVSGVVNLSWAYANGVKSGSSSEATRRGGGLLMVSTDHERREAEDTVRLPVDGLL